MTYFQHSFQTNYCLIAHSEKSLYVDKSCCPYADFTSHYAFLVFLDESAVLTILPEIQTEPQKFQIEIKHARV